MSYVVSIAILITVCWVLTPLTSSFSSLWRVVFYGVLGCVIAELEGRAAKGAYKVIVRFEDRLPKRVQIALLDALVLVSSPKTAEYREGALCKLLVLHMAERNYKSGLICTRKLDKELRHPTMSEAEVKRRRAECLDALGFDQEARQEAQDALAALDEGPADVASLQTKAALLVREGRLKEAYEAHRQLLASAPPGWHNVRVRALLHLAKDAVKAGDGEAKMHWALQLLSEAETPQHRCYGYLTAAVAATEQRDWEAAERYARDGIAYAESMDCGTEAAQIKAVLAGIIGQRPDPIGALALLDEVIREHPHDVYLAWIGKVGLLYTLGRFHESIEAANQALSSVSTGTPSRTKRWRAGHLLSIAHGQAMLGSSDESKKLLLQAHLLFVDGEKLLACDALHVYCMALDGDAESARAESGAVLEKLKSFPDSNSLRLTCHSQIALAAWKLGDWEMCREQAQAYLDAHLEPWKAVVPYFLLGECARAGGDEAGAREHYARAARVHPEFYWSRMALEAMGDPFRAHAHLP